MLKRKKMAGVAVLTAVCLLTQSQIISAYGTGISGSVGKTNGTSRLQNTAPLIGGKSGEAPTGVSLENLEIDPEEGDSASVLVEMKGAVIASLISVNLPADGLGFSVSPEASFDLSAPAVQIPSSDVEIESHSAASVKLEIARVDDIGDNDVKFSEKLSSERE